MSSGMGSIIRSASVESYAHKAAKATLVSWLRGAAVYDEYCSAAGIKWRVNRDAPWFGVWEEYPIVTDDDCCVWDENPWWVDLESLRVHGSKEVGRSLLAAGLYTLRGFNHDRWGLRQLQAVFWNDGDWPDRDVVPWMADRPPIPTYAELVELGTPPRLILDVAVQHKGSIISAFEIVHKHGLTDKKRAMLRELNCSTYVVSADWILSQVGVPEHLVVMEAFRHYPHTNNVELARARA